MAAYAALVSVMHMIEHIEHHPLPPISLDKKHVESLTKNVTSLQEFLESYPHTGENEEGQALLSRIADAAFAVEDLIESRVVDQILVASPNHGQNIEFCQRLQKVIEDMECLIKNEVMEIKKKMGVQHQLQRSPTSRTSGHNATMVGFDAALLKILEKLVGEEDGREIIPIIGMGGIGKTTLARNVYSHRLIKERFDIRVWVTISQEFNARSILSEALCEAKQISEVPSRMNVREIGEDLYKYLFGRKYLIIMDDMWSIEAWDEIKFSLPDNKNGSRIVVTTRLVNLARDMTNSYGHDMKLLGKDKSWDLFSKIVFAEEACTPEVEEIGRKIAASCRGLPLSITVISGLLAKSDYNREQWEHVLENLNSTLNSENDEHCLKVLKLSYNQLPVHLKPCFLYMGVFKKASAIRIPKLIRLWVAEGFLKPIKGKDLEEVAKEYLNDLVDRNLVSITEGGRKRVKIHDLLRDLSQRQSQTERFYNVVSRRHGVDNIPQDSQLRRFIISERVEGEVLEGLLSTPLARSMISYVKESTNPRPDLRLLRIFGACGETLHIESYHFQENKFQLVNLRYIRLLWFECDSMFSDSFHLFWNLQTLLIQAVNSLIFTPPVEIWTMPQLRHVDVLGYLYLPDPPACNGQDNIVLENLQTLMTVTAFKCSDEVVKRIPNIKKLEIEYIDKKVGETYLDNLERLNKLKSFKCISHPYPEPEGSDFLQSLTFPQSLKKLSLNSSHVHWEDMLGKIGALPLLQKLEIRYGSFRTGRWETVEGHFSSLKKLAIYDCEGLVEWSSESSHFPRLEEVVLYGLHELNEIPFDIGEIATMQSILLKSCSENAVDSAKRILEVHEELYGEDTPFQVYVLLSHADAEAPYHLVSPKFKFYSPRPT